MQTSNCSLLEPFSLNSGWHTSMIKSASAWWEKICIVLGSSRKREQWWQRKIYSKWKEQAALDKKPMNDKNKMCVRTDTLTAVKWDKEAAQKNSNVTKLRCYETQYHSGCGLHTNSPNAEKTSTEHLHHCCLVSPQILTQSLYQFVPI